MPHLPFPLIASLARRAGRRFRMLALGVLAAWSMAGLAQAQPVAAPAASKPLWSELSPAQQQALAPLAGEWSTLSSKQKKRWLAIGDKYAAMEPARQARLQQRMREWSRLTPEQRRVARESYARARKLKPQQKAQEWARYQLLTPEQKKQLAAEAAARRRVANLPAPTQATPASPSPDTD